MYNVLSLSLKVALYLFLLPTFVFEIFFLVLISLLLLALCNQNLFALLYIYIYIYIYILRILVLLHSRTPQYLRVLFLFLFLSYRVCRYHLSSCKALHIDINFLDLWCIRQSPSLVQCKKDPECLVRKTAQVFLLLIKFLLQSLVSRSFLVLRNSFLTFSFIQIYLMVFISNMSRYL